MRHRNLIRRSNRRPRGGIAPLEFVMALPLLFLLFICITWLGFSVIGQTEVLIEARNKAWKRRFEDASKKPLVFARMPTYDEGADYVTEKASKRVQISPIFDRVPGPEASHTILAGSWDWRAMPLDGPPNWRLQGIAAMSGTAGAIQDVLSKLSGDYIEDLLKGLAKEAIKEAIKKYEPLDKVFGAIDSFDDVESKNKATENQADKAKQQDQGERDAKNTERRKQIEEIDKEIAATKAEIDKLTQPPENEKPPGDEQNPPEGEDQPKQPTDLERIKKLEFLNGKLKRLQSDRYDISRELE